MVSTDKKKLREPFEYFWTLDKIAYFFCFTDQEVADKFSVTLAAAERARRRAGIKRIRGVPQVLENSP